MFPAAMFMQGARPRGPVLPEAEQEPSKGMGSQQLNSFGENPAAKQLGWGRLMDFKQGCSATRIHSAQY